MLKENCSSKLCEAALELLEYLLSVTDLVGVTGGLAYHPLNASDIDIVAYGPRIENVYRVLRDLRDDGKTTPFTGTGHAWSSDDLALNKVLSKYRVLLGYFKSFEYNVRLVYCTKPAPCNPIQVLGEVEVEAEIIRALGFSTPSYYMARPKRVYSKDSKIVEKITKIPLLQIITYRLRYVEIPEKTTILVRGELELHEGVPRIIPDHGGRILVIGFGSKG